MSRLGLLEVLSVLHALPDSFRKLRSFVFIERISEVTEIFEHERDFRTITERISREGGVADVFWLNPEPWLYWNYGDSVMAAYERHCDGAFECWTTRHLESFVNVVAGGAPATG